jgi:ketosteroid isomerase-like protein
MRATALGLFVVLAACKVAPSSLSDADKTAIRALSDSFVVFFRANRDSAIAAVYSDNAIMMPPNQGSVEGRAAIRAVFDAYPGLPDFTASSIDIDGRGDLAYVRGTYALTVPAANGRSAVADHGKFVQIRRRQSDGRWLIAMDIFNSDVPLSTK